MDKTFKISFKISAVVHGIIIALLIFIPLIRGCIARRKPKETITFVSLQPEPQVQQDPVKDEPPPDKDNEISDTVKKKPTRRPSPTPKPTKKATATARPTQTPTPTPTAKATKAPRPTNTPKPTRKPRPTATRTPRPTPRVIRRSTPTPRISQRDIRNLLSEGMPTHSAASGTTGRSGAGMVADPSTPSWYKASIQQTLYNNWNQPTSLSTAVGKIVRVRIRIARDGTISSKQIVRPSGVRKLDESVNDVLRSVTKLSPLPSSIKDPYLDMDIEFELQR